MIKEIITSHRRLSHVCEDAIEYGNIKKISRNLLKTAKFHADTETGCVGLAANQIGYLSRIIVVKTMSKVNDPWTIMINPEYILKFGGFKSDVEECLSHPGIKTKIHRYKKIRIRYKVESDHGPLITTIDTFKNFEARIIQHETDHLNGILI